jgi:hypothetical protein
VTEIAGEGFYAYDPAFRGGVTVAAGDLTGDGVAEIITGAGPGGQPQVRVFSLAGGGVTEVAGFFAYDPAFPGGVTVAAADLNRIAPALLPGFHSRLTLAILTLPESHDEARVKHLGRAPLAGAARLQSMVEQRLRQARRARAPPCVGTALSTCPSTPWAGCTTTALNGYWRTRQPPPETHGAGTYDRAMLLDAVLDDREFVWLRPSMDKRRLLHPAPWRSSGASGLPTPAVR